CFAYSCDYSCLYRLSSNRIQVKMKEIEDFEKEIGQLEDKKKKTDKQEQLREEHRGHVRELQKQMKEQERKLEQRQREDEEQVERMARENLALKHKQEKELEGMKELQAEQQVWLQYKNKGSIKDQQKIQKLEKDTALTQRIFQEILGVFSIVLKLSMFQRANENLDKSKFEIKEMHWLKKQVWSCFRFYFTYIFLYMQRLYNAANQVRRGDLGSCFTSNVFLAQSASLESHDTHSMDRNIMKISLEETSELVDRPPYPLQPLAEAEGAQQRSDATTSGSTTTSTPPDFTKLEPALTCCICVCVNGPTHLGLLEQMLMCVIGKAYPLHTLPNDPEEMTFDLLQTERWPVTTEVINRKFQQSVSQSGESDASVKFSSCWIRI
uniref:Uncharacterized protein n=1 Tax=Sinocyclocheilus anshuiensis TaxID=1608454 RepID=A0A671MJC8_9TELE